MTSSLPSPKPRAFTKWLETGSTPVAAVDNTGRLQYHNDAFAPYLHPSTPEHLPSDLLPPAEVWSGTPCYRKISPTLLPTETPQPLHDFVAYLPLYDHTQTAFGCLLSLGYLASTNLTLSSNELGSPLSRAASDALQHELLEFRKRWGDVSQLDILGGNSPQIRKTLQQVQLAIATQTPVLIRGHDLNACHDLAKGIWLQRFKRSQISSAGFQFMPISARVLDGEMLRSALDLSLPIQLRGDFIETCLLIEDVSALHENASHVLAEWLFNHRPPQIFATQILDKEQSPSNSPAAWSDPYFSILTVDIPSLRERPEDIAAIATRILNHSTPAGHGPAYAFSNHAIETLLAYPWNGDFTELRALIRQIALPSNRFIVELTELPLPLRSYIGGKETTTPQTSSISLDDTLLELEKNLIEKALHEARGNRALAARKLGISRARLLRRLSQLSIVAQDMDPSLELDSMSEPPHSRHASPPHLLETHADDQDKASMATDEISAIDFIPVEDE